MNFAGVVSPAGSEHLFASSSSFIHEFCSVFCRRGCLFDCMNHECMWRNPAILSCGYGALPEFIGQLQRYGGH